MRSFHPKESLHEYARMAELVDALDSKSNVPYRRAGSSPALGTRPKSPSFFGETSSFFVRFNLTSFAQYLRAAETRGGVAQARRAAPLGDEDVRKCRSSAPCCTLGRRRCTKVSLKRAVLHTWATIKYESVAQVSRAAPSGDDKCGFRCRRVSFIHTSFCPAPLGNGKARRVA